MSAALACAKRDTIAPADLTNAASGQVLQTSILIVSSVSAPIWAADPLTVSRVSITGDTLQVAVTYSGGCRHHALQPIAESVWAKSLPVQVSARVAHNAGGDVCEALVTRTLHVDLSPLKALYRERYNTTSGRIAVRLAGTDSIPVYSF